MGLWGQATGLDPIPIEPMDPTKATGKKASPTDDEINAYKAEHATYLVEYKAWSRANQQALGTIVLRCNASIQEDLSQQDLAEDAWSRLKATYGTATPTSTYKDFKEALGIGIRTDCYDNVPLSSLVLYLTRLAPSGPAYPNPCPYLALTRQPLSLLGTSALLTSDNATFALYSNSLPTAICSPLNAPL